MATLTTKRAAAGVPAAGPGLYGNLKVATGTIELAAAQSVADIVEFCKVPKGAVVVDGLLYGDDIDTGTETYDINIGWAANGSEAADPDGFGNFGVSTGDAVTGIKPEVSIWLPFGGAMRLSGPRLFTAETTITGTVVAAAALGGTGTLTVVVYYFVDENYETG